MDVKNAIASSDGLTVNEHFARTHNFHIFRLQYAGHEFVELRKINPACSGHAHDDDALAKLSQTLGEGIWRKLHMKGDIR